MKTIRTVLFGVGAMGSLIARFLFQKEGVEIVGAIDAAQDKVGRTLDEVLGLKQRVEVAVSNDADATLSKTKPNIVVHATSSHLEDVYPQLASIVKHGANVVSTCEELSYPCSSAPQLAKKLDALAKKHHATILGTGINPGFLMDTLVITLTSVCQTIDRIQATRVIDAATRRLPFQKKIGAGLSEREFREAIEKKSITGHVGLEQSISMIASALAWKLDRIEVNVVEAVIAKKAVRSEAIKVEVGESAGLRQVAKGFRGNKNVIILDFQAYIGAEEEFDSITIAGVPCINQKITPCVHGDVGTVAMIANSIPKVINAAPGLVSMKDLPVPSAATEDMVKYIGEF
ncbi:MAG: dihydrodipicolinate reductase [Candidatus Bathyarchaeota archaeon]|nr:MAG: dihydrodipicolinate reductase [Candidatus Bathyarchaeota archaeon]